MFKKATFVFSLAMILCLAVSGLASAQPLPVGNGKVFTVYPTGVDDTDNLLAAFAQAKAAGPGSTVQLAPGNFFIRMITIEDFDGYFKGAGQDVTIIDTFADQECQSTADHNIPSLIMFYRGYPRVSDMTITITPEKPCLPWTMVWWGWVLEWQWMDGLQIVAGYFNPATDCEKLVTVPVSGLVERVTIAGLGPWVENYSMMFALNMGGAMSIQDISEWDCKYPYKVAQGEFTVRQVYIRDAYVGMHQIGLVNSKVTLGGSPEDANQMQWCDVGIWNDTMSGSILEASYNQTETGTGIWVDGGNQLSIYNIHHNNLLTGWGTGIELIDMANSDPSDPNHAAQMKVNVHHNHISITQWGGWGIWGEYLEGGVIHQNVIDGDSDWAMIYGLLGPTKGVRIMGNDLSNFTSSNPPYKIQLGPGTEQYRVTVSEPDSVLDLGTGNLVNEVPRRQNWSYTPAFLASLNQKITAFPFNRFPQVRGMNLLAPVNYIYMPLIQR